MKRIQYKITLLICDCILHFDSSHVLKKVFKKLNILIKNNGTLFAVKYIKQCKLHVTRYMVGEPILVSPIKISLDNEGFPLIFADLKPLTRGSLIQRKTVLTILNLTRTIEPAKGEEIPLNLNSITDPFNGTSKTLDPTKLDICIKRLGIEINLPEWSVKDLELITKAGPNGPATLSILSTIRHFGYNELTSLMALSCDNFLKWFMDLYSTAAIDETEDAEGDKPKQTFFTRRLSVVKDPECKMRIIAIFDYISQQMFDILSKQLFKSLENIPSDRTFTQDPHFTHTKIDRSQRLHSIDLTAATDRFPVDLQHQVLAKLLSPGYADYWKSLMVGSPFRHPQMNEAINYSVGQPMGAKSSWPMFTLTHHIAVQYAALECGLVKFDKYILLGDDIVINDDNVAKKYIEIMNYLGVETSPAKTHVSSDTYEFAKRWIHIDLGELTGLPLRGIITNINNIFILYNILFDFYQLKGNLYTGSKTLLDVCIILIRAMPQKVVGTKKKFFGPANLRGRLLPYQLFMRIAFDIASYDEIRNFFATNVTKNDEYMIGTNMKVIHSEIERVLSLVLVGQAWLAVKRIAAISPQLAKKAMRTRNGSPHPVIRAIMNNIERLVNYSKTLMLQTITLKQSMEKSPLLDIDAIFSQQRNKYAMVNMNGLIARKFRSELRFDPNQVQIRTRSLQVVKEIRDTHQRLIREYGGVD
nr:RNA-dependent RNA polymerase [Monilinia fructicola mitovirus 5]